MISEHVPQATRPETRFLAVEVLLALTALGVGALAVFWTYQELLLLAILLLAMIAAWTVPLNVLPVVLAGLVPFQFYFFIPGTNLAAPAAFIFVATAALRVLLTRGFRPQAWMIPTAVLFVAASLAAFGAQNRSEAFKGIYQWSAIVACVYIAAQTTKSIRATKQIILLLAGLGMLQAILGLVEYTTGLNQVLSWLSTTLSESFFPPNLLRERLSDLSFNWNLDGRTLPFGTFINDIDYAVFLAAILVLVFAQGLSSTRWQNISSWFSAALVVGAALLLTLKGSGFIAFAAGGLALAVCYAPRLSRQMRIALPVLGLVALLLVLPFGGSLSERAAFLIQREQGDSRDVGRLDIWASLIPAYLQRPLFGYGMGNSPSSGDVLRTLRYGAFGTNPVSPESAYVQLLIETGTVGFLALLTLFAMTFASAVRQIRINQNERQAIGILAALVALWVGNLTVSAITTDQNGMLMGLLIGLVFSKWNAA